MTCSTCQGTCRVPTACHEPQPESAPKRRPMFRPTFDLRGPYKRLRRPSFLARAIAGFCGLAVALAVAFLFIYR